MSKFDLIKKEIEKLAKNAYSPEVELSHLKTSWEYLLKIKPDASEIVQIATLGHDIERYFPDRKTRKEYFDNYDEYKKAHAENSAKILCEILDKFDFDTDSIERVRYLVQNHEVGGDEDAELVKRADSVAYFVQRLPSFLKERGAEETRRKIKFMYDRLDKDTQKMVRDIVSKNPEVNNFFQETLGN